MSTLADQLKTLALQPTERKVADTRKSNPSTGGRSPESNAKSASDQGMLFLKLPRFGTVARLDEERGFGFISGGAREDVFFHFRGFPGRLPDGQKLPPVGSQVLFITGSDPRRPHEPKKGAVLWAPVEIASASLGDVPTTQGSADALRRKRLSELPRQALWGLLETAWYAKTWGGNAPAPTDLEDDVLEQVVSERLVEMSPAGLVANQVSGRLAKSHYQFATRLSPGSQACDFTRLLEVFAPAQLAMLGVPDILWIQSGRLSPDLRSRLLEWHMLTRTFSEPRGNWESCFPGTEAIEVELATRFLADDMPQDAFIDAWLDRIVRNGLLSDAEAEAWAARNPDLAVSLFSQLPAVRQYSLLSEWRETPLALDKQLQQEPSRAKALLTAASLAFDLETDGKRIWEIGCARNGQTSLLHDERSGTNLDVAMADLWKRIQAAPLVVGHNVLAWDWPIVARTVATTSVPLLWDTLLIGYLLEPQATSHALGGRHHADQDALDTLQLFERQLDRLPADVAYRVLVGEFSDTAKLLDAIIEALRGAHDFARECPSFISEEQASAAELIVVPKSRLREFDWVPDASVVSADASEGLAIQWREVDVALLREALPETAPDPAARVLVAVAELAAVQGIALRRNMIPVWLLERDSRLRSAVDMACVMPKAGSGWCIASLPTSVEWWANRDPSSCLVLGLSDDVLVLDRRQVAPSDLAQTLGEMPAAPFMRSGETGPALRWLLVDRAAHVLDSRGGLAAFTTFPVRDAAMVQAGCALAPSSRPQLARRRHHVLHPRAEDQGSYWAEVLRTFKEVAIVGAGSVPILLISSSQSSAMRDLLATGLAEVGLGEVKPEHRSQREHMLRASSGRLALIDMLDQWPVWQSLAQSAGVVLQPVIEALPIEEWHACAETRTTGQAAFDSETAQKKDGFTAVGGAALLESATGLVQARLHGWMGDVGLSTSQLPVVLIDPRISDMTKALSNLVDALQLVETPFLADQAQRLELVLSQFKLAREEAPSGLDAMERFLVANWQPRSGGGGNRVAGFKPSQTMAMEAICERSANVLVSLPTGEGKSVLFQVPALCRGLRNRRLTLVISPLKALMRDQVERLREQGFSESVDYLSGDRPPSEIAEVIQGVLDHRIVLLYVAPERTRSGVFLDVLYKRMQADKGLEHVVVDETHCVNQWGYEFRPDYFHALNLLLRLCRAMDLNEPTPFLLLSATITASDRARLQAIMAGDSGGAGSPLPLLARPDSFSNPLRTHIAVVPRRVRGTLNDRRNFDQALAERLPHIEEAVSAARRNRASTGQRSAVIVFVSSRYHAEVLAQRLAQATSGQVDYYHAGLDAGSREEIYTRFLDGDLGVLVATKAFGMGMDIPDIHWVVHLAPPGYLEDYLQEVGRIGRGERERKNAQLEKLSATLLFSDQDFESIRGLRARSALSLPIIRDLHEKVCEHAYKVDDQRLAIIPAEGYSTPQVPVVQSAAARRAAATRVRMGLYWLERAERVRLCGSVPDLIEMTAYPSSLERISREYGLAAEVASLILQIGSTDTSISEASLGGGSSFGASPAPDGVLGGISGVLGQLFSSLSDAVGILFDGSARTPSRAPPSPRLAHAVLPSGEVATAKTVILNLSQIKLRSSTLKSIGDVLAVLGDLEKRGGVSLNREIDVVPRKLASEPSAKISELFQYVDGGVAELIRRLAKKGRIEFNPFEMVEDVEGPRVGDDKRRMYERSFINGFRSLARASGVRLRQLVRDDDKVIWEAVLPQSSCSKADSRRQRFLQGAKSLFAAVANQRSIPISKLVDQLRAGSHDGRFRESDLNKVAGLLSAMSLVSISPELVPLSHVVSVTDVDGRLEDQANIWDELRQVNELAEARNLAMEVFANVNTEAQPAFIEGYFDTTDGLAIRAFLDSQLGELVSEDLDGPSTLLLEMQEKLRATKAVEFFERFRVSEESAQWEVAKAPFDQHIMVNAGPGAGKTFVLVGRIAHLIREQNIDPSQIIVLAFNRAVVFEIRRRIRELFKSLGYAAYAERLRVSTFHSLALRSLAREGIEITRESMQTLLSDFASRLSRDPSFAQRVAGGARCVLVDEFQDVTDDVYRVIKHLHSGSGARAGVMVIGDDDQDILRWQRKNDGSAHQFSEKYFDQFARDFGGDTFQEYLLGVNFRSGESIVERSQLMISGFFERTSRSRRLKISRLIPRTGAPEGTCQAVEWRGRTWGEAVEETAALLEDLAGREGQSTAVLCRSNAEVAEAHRLLSRVLPNLTVQGAANLRVADLRHVALWLDHLREAAAKDDAALSEDLRRDIFNRTAQAVSVPEYSRLAAADIRLDDLWELCGRERSFAHLSSLIQFVDELRTDELVRLSGMVDGASTVVVSTMHKVKGLEFDNVVILPSAIQFGAGGRDRRTPDLEGDAAEEARLLYVGMTRAKENLTYYRGDRERSWGRRDPVPYEGLRAVGQVLVGSMEDVSLGWAMQPNAFNPTPDECQRYIETEVAVGDPIELGGRGGGAFKSFMHKGSSGQLTQVGFLAKQHVVGGPNASLKVSAVVRFRPSIDETLTDCVRERGWGYVVLVSGRLR